MIRVIASKKALRLAVDRNRAKRRLRSVLDKLLPGWRQNVKLDGRLYANRETLSLPFATLCTQVKHALSL
jgi:ribonuclease P protein component